jgi:hypothetical protein
MTLGEFIDLLDERQNISDYADYELLMPDGMPITGVFRIDDKLYLSDVEKGFREQL